MISENLTMTGDIVAILYDESGNIKEKQEVKNMVVTVGKNLMASRLVGTAANVISHIAVGTGSTAPAIGDTTLATELARVAISSGTATTNVATYVATFGPGVGTGSINECGLFNASSSGTMLARSTSVVVTKGTLDTLALTWTVTIN